jgi:hypothetical protein
LKSGFATGGEGLGAVGLDNTTPCDAGGSSKEMLGNFLASSPALTSDTVSELELRAAATCVGNSF